MKQTKIYLESATALREFRAAVSLHSHTLHSQETLFFLHHLVARFRLVRSALERGKTQYRAAHGSPLDLQRAWWTPPLAPYDAWLLERNEIQNRLGLNALVSLTDHDNIEGPLSLRVLDECRTVPVSIEWTVPYSPTFFHLGVHNLPPHLAQDLMAELKHLTESCHTMHGRGWRQWSDCVFYHCDDGVVRSLTTLSCNRVPSAVQLFVRGISLLQCRRFRQTFCSAFPRQQEFAF